MKATIKILNDHLSGKVKTLTGGYKYKGLAPQIRCTDGTKLSVQASEGHYCFPREHTGPYSKVEVGFPSVEPPKSWSLYFDGVWEEDNRTDSVYGYLPIEMVVDYINNHGGINSKKTNQKGGN